ncbi:PREDICTED: proline-rich transmembrane protein 1-like [Gekko japonicus]|uniref:Proline-rich transmembrane protein 1-like n=1 Tax=Gekko japonicus TaxID=146911 RepID=A0ABM1KIN8_GEKJA|nr:PREDICTED: proline-rich transmembrane protein 1-like [Gekko japonicus]
MDHPKNQEGTPSDPNPPPYSEKQPYNQPSPPAHGPAYPTMPTQYQPYYPPYSAVPGYASVVQSPVHTTVIVPVEPTHEPDYLGYSIFTMLCCCVPLGIAALVYSIRTRDANRMGNGTEAQQNSRMARNFAHSALFVGIALITVYIVLKVSVLRA